MQLNSQPNIQTLCYVLCYVYVSSPYYTTRFLLFALAIAA